MDRLAIVVPCYNEEEVLSLASGALRDVLEDLIHKGKIADDSFILFVNDGSKDRTWELIEKEHADYPVRVKGGQAGRQCGASVCADGRAYSWQRTMSDRDHIH